jgi:Fur family transcriptional regulator, ferric uptake regulator
MTSANGCAAQRSVEFWLQTEFESCRKGVKFMPLPHTEAPGYLVSELESRGVRMTRQRRTILGIIETASRHLDAAQILRKAQKQEPEIDRVTIYRTLDLLKRHGLIDELDLMHLQGEKHFYERKTPREHVHMTCLRCGRVTEFESRFFDDLKKQVQKDCQFQIAVARMEIGGYCASCRA